MIRDGKKFYWYSWRLPVPGTYPIRASRGFIRYRMQRRRLSNVVVQTHGSRSSTARLLSLLYWTMKQLVTRMMRRTMPASTGHPFKFIFSRVSSYVWPLCVWFCCRSGRSIWITPPRRYRSITPYNPHNHCILVSSEEKSNRLYAIFFVLRKLKASSDGIFVTTFLRNGENLLMSW